MNTDAPHLSVSPWPAARFIAMAMLLALALSISACTGSGDNASGLVGRWLTAMQSPSGDRGWSLLHPDARQTRYGNKESAYIAKVSQTDWSDFDWGVDNAVSEDNGTYVVMVDVTSPDRAPKFLMNDGLVQLVPTSEGSRGAVIVLFGEGGAGVYLSPK